MDSLSNNGIIIIQSSFKSSNPITSCSILCNKIYYFVCRGFFFKCWSAYLFRMCRVINDPFKSTLPPVHLVQSIASGTNPQNTLVILEYSPHFIVCQAMDITRNIQVTGKCAGLFVHTIQSSFLWLSGSGIACSNPKCSLPVFINGTYQVITDAR